MFQSIVIAYAVTRLGAQVTSDFDGVQCKCDVERRVFLSVRIISPAASQENAQEDCESLTRHLSVHTSYLGTLLGLLSTF